MTIKTLSFCILDDLNPIYFRTVNIKSYTKEKIIKGIRRVVGRFLNGKERDPTGYYFKIDYNEEEIENCLETNRYYVINRYQKYYVIGFSINFTRFEVYSKDCDKKLIEWGNNDGEIKGIITDENYNENPVIKVLKELKI